MEFDDSLAEAHTARAVVAHSFDWEWKTAEYECRAPSIESQLRDRSPPVRRVSLAMMGRFDEAEVEIKQARALDPLSLIMATDHGVILYYGRHYDRAIEELRRVRDMDPAYPRTAAIDAAYIETGKNAKVTADLESWKAVDDGPWQ